MACSRHRWLSTLAVLTVVVAVCLTVATIDAGVSHLQTTASAVVFGVFLGLAFLALVGAVSIGMIHHPFRS